MRIEVVRWHPEASRASSVYPRVILERGRPWEDWPSTETPERPEDVYRTLYDVYYDGSPDTSRQPLGSVKILQRGKWSPELPEVLSNLPEDCFSLGQTIDYYAALDRLGEPACSDILRALRDVTIDEEIALAFQDEPGFRASLLRFSEAERIFQLRAWRLHRDSPPASEFRFRFRTQLEGFDEPHEIGFEFFPRPSRLGRLMAIIGENGTGKTQLLARLAWALWGLRRTGWALEPARPAIGRVIAVSYSALDAFERPPDRYSFVGHENRSAFDNYCYCGFRSAEGAVRPEILFDALQRDLVEIALWNRQDHWRRMLDDLRLLHREPDLESAIATNRPMAVAEAAKRLAAGEKTALCVLTRLLARLRNRSFVLFDEPELNLHPSLLASLLRVLHGWLEDFDAHGIVATHSPIVLQEIPGRMVRVLAREGRIPLLRKYESESFGQNLSEIVVDAFGSDDRDRNYASILRDLVDQGVSRKDIESAFNGALSLGTRMTLRYLERRGGNDEES